MSKADYELIDNSKVEFKLPEQTDFYNITDFNDNTTNTITALTDLKSGIKSHVSSADAHSDIQTSIISRAKSYTDSQAADLENKIAGSLEGSKAYADNVVGTHNTSADAHRDIRDNINPIITIKSVTISDDSLSITVSVDYFYNTSANGNGNVTETFTVSSNASGAQALYFVNGDIVSHTGTYHANGIPLIVFMYNEGITEWSFLNDIAVHNADVQAHNDIQNKITPYYAFELLSVTDNIIKGTLRYKNSQDKIISEAFEFSNSDITYSAELNTPCYIYVPKNFYDGDRHIYISKASDVTFSDVIVVAQVVLSTDNKWIKFHIIGDNVAIVNNKIAEHNTSTTAHADIRAEISNEIQNHNNSQMAHDDIRKEISDRHSLMQQELDSKLSEKADLENGKIPASQLPSYVDDVIEGYYHVNGGQGLFYSSTEYSEGTVISAESGKIYVDLNTNKTYRYSGSQYVIISETIALGETSATAYRGDFGKIAYEHSQSVHARTDATKVEKSNTNGNIKIDDVETTVYSHPATHPASMITGLEDALSDCVTISELNNTLKDYAKSSELPEGVQVIDNLESNVGTSALSANQGRILNERINNIGSVIEVITTSDIDEICGTVIQVAEEVKL